MPLTIPHAATRAAVVAASTGDNRSQPAQLAALIAEWAGGVVHVKSYSGATLRDTGIYATWAMDALTPRGMTLGALATRSIANGALSIDRTDYCLADGTVIFSLDGADTPLAVALTATSHLNLADAVATKMRVTANSGLPAGVLEIAAAVMTAGQWVQLTMPTGMDATDLFRDTPNWVTAYIDKAAGYDPVRQEIHWIAQAHSGDQRQYKYDEATHAIAQIADPVWDTGGSAYPGYLGHGYQHNTLDPVTGDRFYRHYGDSPAYARWFDAGAGTWGTTANFSWGSNETAGGLEWCPLIGTQGGLVSWCRAELRVWDKAANTVSNPTSPFGSDFGVHGIAIRNWIDGTVYIGGGNSQTSLAKVGAAGTASALTSCPVAFGVAAAVTTSCPESGDLLVIKGNASAYAYSYAAGTWAEKSMAGAPAIFGASVGDGAGVIACPIPAYGVVAFFSTIAGNEMWLHKHA